MPKPQKMHPKTRAPTTMQKAGGSGDDEELTRNFELELCWCIQQLERALTEKKLNEKQLTESWKVLQVLKNNGQPVIRKRQLMRTHFGDYRAKMAAEEKKLVKLANSIKIEKTPAKATFVRRSAFLSTGDDSFRFRFQLGPEQLNDAAKDKPSEGGQDIDNTKQSEAISKTTEGSEMIDKTSEGGKNVKTSEDQRIDDKSDRAETSDVGKFKFTFTESSFRFNFSGSNDS